MMKKELTDKEKWYPVDRMLNNINSRKKRGDKNPCYNELEEYINYNFNRENCENCECDRGEECECKCSKTKTD